MITDVHCHYFPSLGVFSASFLDEVTRARPGPPRLACRADEYLSKAAECNATIVFGGKARLSGIWVDDKAIADFTVMNAGRFIGFLSVDPTQRGWQDEMRHGHEALGLRGIKLLPMYAGFYPQDPKLDPLWKYAQEKRLPVVLHTGTTFVSQARLDCTLPRHLDDVARRFPEVRMVLAHLGHPYEAECVAVIRKHRHVYADVSALFYRPWQLFHSLMLAHEYGVWNKLLFGSDYPFTTVDESVEGLRSVWGIRVNRFGLPAEELDALLHRSSLALLGLT